MRKGAPVPLWHSRRSSELGTGLLGSPVGRFEKGQSSPCSFYHKGWQIRTVVHGDDFLSEGPGKNLEEMDKEMRKSFALKTEILGGDPGDVQSLKVLNRQISWKDGQINWEADPRHVEILARQLGMEGSSTVKTPGDKNDADQIFRYRDVDGEGGSVNLHRVGEQRSRLLGKSPTQLILRHVSKLTLI